MSAGHWRDLRFLDSDGGPVEGTLIYKAVCEHLREITTDPEARAKLTPDALQVQFLAVNFPVEFSGMLITTVISKLMGKKIRTPEETQKLALCIRLVSAGVHSF